MLNLDYINQEYDIPEDTTKCAKCKKDVSIDEATIVYGKVVCLECSAEIYQTFTHKTTKVGVL